MLIGPDTILGYSSFSFRILLKKVEHISCSFGSSRIEEFFLGLLKIKSQKVFVRHHFIRKPFSVIKSKQ